jgi:hypothetical protein
MDADVASELDRSHISNVSLITPPTPTLEPVYPRKGLIMLAALGIGLLFGMGLPFRWFALCQSTDRNQRLAAIRFRMTRGRTCPVRHNVICKEVLLCTELLAPWIKIIDLCCRPKRDVIAATSRRDLTETERSRGHFKTGQRP